MIAVFFNSLSNSFVLVKMLVSIVFLLCFSVCLNAQSPKDKFIKEYRVYSLFKQNMDRGFSYRLNYSQFLPSYEQKNKCEGVMTPFGYYIKFTESKNIYNDGRITIGKNIIDLANTKYTAELEVHDDSSYVLNQIQILDKGDPPASCYLLGALCDLRSGKSYDQAVFDPRVSVIDYGDYTFSGVPVKKLRLLIKYKFPNFTMDFLNDYFFDVNKGWLCIAYRERGQFKKQEEVYTETIHSFSTDFSKCSGVPNRIEDWEVDEIAGTRSRKRTSEIFDVVSRRVDQGEYHLSKFGIAEPEGVNLQKPIGLWVWLTLAALFCGALTFILRAFRNIGLKKITK